MPVYAISYDLRHHKDQDDYVVLWEEMERLNAHRTQFSMWLCGFDGNPSEVLEHFEKFVHFDDTIWVIEIKERSFAFINSEDGTNKWINNTFNRPQ